MRLSCCTVYRLDQNLHWKLGQQAPSFGTILAYLETTHGLKYYFLSCFSRLKAETFSICWKKNFGKPHKISTHSAHSDNCYFHFFYRLSDWVEILWGFTKFFFKQKLKISVFCLIKWKSFTPKKYDLGFSQYKNTKSFVYWPNFQRQFLEFAFIQNRMKFMEPSISNGEHP